MVQLEFLGMNFTCVFDSLEHYKIPPTHECLIPLISKLMGYAIICGASVVKVPQIILIMKNRSIEGLSVTSFELEVVAFTISLAYCVWKNLPFSAYGELFFLLLQGIFLVALLYYFSPRLGPLTWLKAAVYCAFTPQLLAGKVNETFFESLYAGQHAILIFARLPQIYDNYKAQSTGQLSFLTNFVSFGGGAARLLTLLHAKAPGNMLLGTTLGLLLNGTIVLQIVYYGSRTKNGQKPKLS